jgi:sialate O-acetylesterase
MVKLPAFFSDGMVIGKNAKLWGLSSPHEKISIIFLNKKYETVADENGRFETTVVSKNYGGPFTLTIDEIILTDVYVGRVWLCGGSSNMEEPTSRARLLLNEKIYEDTRIRVFQPERGFDFNAAQTDTNGKWRTMSDWLLDFMPAIPYFFARALLEKESVPIGLICLPVGGSKIESWMPEEDLQEFPDYRNELLRVQKPGWVEKSQNDSDKFIKIWQNSLARKDRGLSEGWFKKDFDDSNWEVRLLFDKKKFPRYGSVWLRKKIFVEKENLNAPVTLKFGRVENSVTVYINGTEIFSVGYMYPPCVCIIPDNLLCEGENTIAVRIVGESHNPSIVSGKEYALVFQNGRAELNGRWKWRVGAVMPMCPPGMYFFSNPVGVYNFMLAPLLGYSLDGIIWAQGETNTANPYDYKKLFASFVKNLRKHFGEVPIIFTQLASYVDPYSYNFIEGFGTPGEYWAILREQQRQCLEISKTAMAVCIDCGEYNDLHPADKKTVGNRLALHARRIVYGEEIISDGPVAIKAENNNGLITIFFEHGVGLWEKGGHTLLDVTDGDGGVHRLYAAVWDEALNVFVGDMNPTTVRFAWADCPVVALYNAYGLPASPFEIKIEKC